MSTIFTKFDSKMVEKNIVDLVKEALCELYKNDRYLIINKVHERSVVFKFGLYFYEIIKCSEYCDYFLDFEYNKNHLDIKRTEDFPNGTYPDIILHKRGKKKGNLLIIEFKTWWNNDNIADINKLQNFTSKDDDYGYLCGLSIIIGKKGPTLTKVIQGVVHNE